MTSASDAISTVPVDKGAAPADPMDAPALRWGVLGAGGIAHVFVRTVTAYTRSHIVAVGSRSLPKAQALAADARAAVAYGSYEELVAADDVDAIYVATPHSHHGEHAILALRAGKHVLVEKAFTRNRAEAEAVFATAAEVGRFAMEAMWTRFLPSTAVVHSEINAGNIGSIVALQADHGQRLDFDRDGRLLNPALAGGALLDLGVYPVSYAHDLLGVPDAIRAEGKLTDTGVDGMVSVTLDYGQRTQADLFTTLWARTPTTAAISGTEGWIGLPSDFYRTNTVRVHYPDDRVFTVDTPSHLGFAYEAAEVARCVAAEYLQSPRLPWGDTLDVMGMLDEIRRQVGVVYPGE